MYDNSMNKNIWEKFISSAPSLSELNFAGNSHNYMEKGIRKQMSIEDIFYTVA